MILAVLLGMDAWKFPDRVACSGGREGEREGRRQADRQDTDTFREVHGAVFQLSHPCLRLSSGRGRCQPSSEIPMLVNVTESLNG